MSDVYSRWKGWADDGEFGRARRGDAKYFRSELRNVGVPKNEVRVLEVGFGNGEFLDVARSWGWDATGTELLPEMVKRARAAGFTAVAADELNGLVDESFDLVVAFDVLEHIPPESTVDFLTTLRRKVRPGGAIVLRYPNADSDLGNPYQNGDPTHVNAIGWLKLTFYAREAGLRIVSYRGARRRGFSTSIVHGVHRWTAGVYATLSGSLRRAIHFPALPVVLTNGNVVCTLRPATG